MKTNTDTSMPAREDSPAAPPLSTKTASTSAPSALTKKPGNVRPPSRRRQRRWLPWAGAVALAVLIIAGLWPRPAPVETARAAVGILRSTINEEGKTRIKNRFAVAAPVSGQLRRITLKAGDPVIAGQTVLAVIDAVIPDMLDARSRALAEAARDTARANFEKARTAHRFATNELQRFAKLYAQKAISIQELEPVQWREAAAARETAAAESALRQAEAELLEFANNPRPPEAITEVKAQVSGRVLRVFEESERVVAAGTRLVEIGNPADLEVVIEVLSRDGAAISPGTKVDLEHWGGARPLAARVRLIEPAAFTKVSALGVEEQRVNVIADILTPPEERLSLGDNFRVEARIITAETNNVLKVPSGALFRRGNAWAAFVVQNGQAQLRTVEVGATSGGEAQVLNGLREGDQVIVYPGDRIREKQAVKPITIVPAR